MTIKPPLIYLSPDETPSSGSSVEGTATTGEPAVAEFTPQSAPDKTETTPGDITAFVPEGYKDKEWVQNILKSENPQTEFFKQYEEQQSLIGRPREGLQVPDENAADEVWQDFYKQIGVPETTESYKLDPIEWDETKKEIGAVIESSRDDEFIGKIAEGARKLGITDKQFKGVAELHDRLLADAHQDFLQKQVDDNRKLDESFTQYMEKIHGPDAKQNLEFGQKLLNESVTPDVRQFINELGQSEEGTKALAVLSGAMTGFHKKYVGEDKLPNPGASATSHGDGDPVEAISAKCRELMTSDAYRNIRHPDNRRVRAEVDALYEEQKQIARQLTRR